MNAGSQKTSGFSINRLRTLILIILGIGVSIYTGVILTTLHSLTDQFGPQVRADLEWRVARGAQELSRAADLGLAMGDAEIVKQAFGIYAESKDVQAIVATNNEGKVIAQHGTPPESPAALVTGKAGELRSTPGYLVSWADANIEGAPVGKVAVVVSTQRHTDAIALLSRAQTTALLGGLAGLLLGFAVVTFFTRAVAQRDAQLSDYASNLERKVDERTRELDDRNRGMRLVLDNVVQGFITVSVSGDMAPERSAIVDAWFDPPAGPCKFSEYLRATAPDYATWFDMGLEQLRDDMLPAELVLDQLPRRFCARERTFDVTYTPILEGARVERLLVILNDVTAQLARERSEREQKELVSLFQRISVDRSGVEEFLTEAAGLVASIRQEADPKVQQRLVHTLKGNCAIYGLESYAELAHVIESDLVEHGEGLSELQRESLVTVWKQAMHRVGHLLGNARRDAIEIDRAELDALLDRVKAGTPSSELLATFKEWTREPVERRLERLARQAVGVARRLSKPEPHIEIVGHGIRLGSDALAPYWTAMVHVVRNAVDHGIEAPEARVAAGKPERATLTFAAARVQGQLVVSVSDDGAGIQWEKIRSKARSRGLPAENQADLVDALFADGVSSRDQASDTSGRGVGMSALRQVVLDLGGSVEVESQLGKGSTFRFSFDERTAVTRAANTQHKPLNSLMPRFG
jgi:signal transduction histidine kinase